MTCAAQVFSQIHQFDLHVADIRGTNHSKGIYCSLMIAGHPTIATRR